MSCVRSAICRVPGILRALLPATGRPVRQLESVNLLLHITETSCYRFALMEAIHYNCCETALQVLPGLSYARLDADTSSHSSASDVCRQR
jgi:hypothetical protein